MKNLLFVLMLVAVAAEAKDKRDDFICQASRENGAWVMKDPKCAKYNTKFILTPKGTMYEKIARNNDTGTQPFSCSATVNGHNSRSTE